MGGAEGDLDSGEVGEKVGEAVREKEVEGDMGEEGEGTREGVAPVLRLGERVEKFREGVREGVEDREGERLGVEERHPPPPPPMDRVGDGEREGECVVEGEREGERVAFVEREGRVEREGEVEGVEVREGGGEREDDRDPPPPPPPLPRGVGVRVTAKGV